MNPLCTPFNIILQDFTIATKQTSLLYSAGLKGVQSADRGSLVTVISCLSPAGHFSPPLLVFPRKYKKQELMNDTPPESIHACHSSGWIQSEIFTQWFLNFIRHTKPTKKRSCYLGTGRALFTHKEPGGHYFSLRESC
jgi:hypothetical protein